MTGPINHRENSQEVKHTRVGLSDLIQAKLEDCESAL